MSNPIEKLKEKRWQTGHNSGELVFTDQQLEIIRDEVFHGSFMGTHGWRDDQCINCGHTKAEALAAGVPCPEWGQNEQGGAKAEQLPEIVVTIGPHSESIRVSASRVVEIREFILSRSNALSLAKRIIEKLEEMER